MTAPASSSTRRAGWIATILAGALAFGFFLRPIHDDDVWLHFAAGRWMIEHRAIPAVDDFSFTAPGVPYVDHEWLAQLLFEGVRRTAGLDGFRVLLAAIAAGAFVVASRTVLRLGGTARAAIVVTLCGLLLDWHLARLRPHLITLLLTAILVDRFVVLDAPLRARRWVGLALLVVPWANAHAAAVIAPAILGSAALGAALGGAPARARRLALLTLGSGAFLLVNPYGVAIGHYAFQTQDLAHLIPEWKSLATLVTDPAETSRIGPGNDFRAQFVLVAVLALVSILGALGSFFRRRGDAQAARFGDPALALPSVGLALAPFVANRHDLFLLVPLVHCAAFLSDLARLSTRAAIAVRALAWAAALTAATGLVRDAAVRLPRYAEAAGGVLGSVWKGHEPFDAVAFLERSGIEGNCLNRPPWGGYLLYRLHPRVRVAFDGRITTLGADVYRDVRDFQNGQRVAETAERYGVDFLLVQPWVLGYGKPPDNPAYVAADFGRDWVEVYRDADPGREGSAVVALRRQSPLFEQNLARVRALPR